MSNQIEEDIRNYIAQNIIFTRGGYPYSDETSLLEQGIIDSMNVLELVMFVEQKFNLLVVDEDIVPENFDSVRKLAEFIRRKSPKIIPAPSHDDKTTKGYQQLGDMPTSVY